jgi:hypothetical protein
MGHVNRRQFVQRMVIVPAAVAALPQLLLGQPGPGNRRGPASPAPVNVIITKTDGSAIRGQILAVDPDRINLKPAPRAGDRGEPAPIDILWKDIKSVSNGLTRQKAIDEWKAANHDKLCETCHGDRVMTCSVCKGTAHDPKSAADCPTCKGTLEVACKASKCDKGKVPCPAPCLKMSEGNWTTQSGMKVRLLSTARGTAWISEHHLGQLFSIDPKTGQITIQGTCPTCGGKMIVDCPKCHGTSKVPCQTCLDRKEAPPCPNNCDHGREPCKTCNGTGLKVA